MRTKRVLGILAAGLLLGGAAVSAGCYDYQKDCLYTLECKGTPDGGTSGGTPEGCDPSKIADAVVNACGLFVAPTGLDTNLGTKDKPFKTVAAAMAAKGATNIYVCAAAMPYAGALVVDKAVTLYGGVDCAKGWVYDATKKTVVASSSSPFFLISRPRNRLWTMSRLSHRARSWFVRAHWDETSHCQCQRTGRSLPPTGVGRV